MPCERVLYMYEDDEESAGERVERIVRMINSGDLPPHKPITAVKMGKGKRATED